MLYVTRAVANDGRFITQITLPSLFPNVEPALLECNVLEYDSALTIVYIGCRNTILVVPVGSDALPVTNSLRAVPVGSGNYSLIYYHPKTRYLYTATTNGLCFVHDTTRSTLNIFKVTFIPPLINDRAISIYVDDRVPTATAVFWGTHQGQLIRTDFPGLTVSARGRVTISENFLLQLSITSILPHPSDDMTLLVAAPEVAISHNSSLIEMDGSYSGIYVTPKDNCQLWNNECEGCGSSPYCGWCYSWGKCLPRSQCTDDASWTQTPTCPRTTNAVPMRTDAAGGANITVSGSFVIGTTSTYNCQWIITSTSYHQSKRDDNRRDSAAVEDALQSFPIPIRVVPPVFVSENMVVCNFPGITNRNIAIGSGAYATATMNVLLNGALWGSSFTEFKIFNCSAFTDCNSCNSQVMAPECGWCYKTASCTMSSVCNVTGINATESWTSNASSCPVSSSWTRPSSISSRTAASSSSTSDRIVKIDLQHVPVAPPNAIYSCVFTSLKDENINRSNPSSYTSSPATVTRSNNDTTRISSVDCTVPTGLAASPDGIYRVHLRLGDALMTDESSSMYFYDCPSITRCDMCSNSTFGDCGWTTSGTCKYKSEISSSEASSTCASLSSSSPSFSDVSASSNLALSLSGANLNLLSSGLNCLFQLSSNPSVSISTTTSSLTASGVSCNTPTDSAFGVGLWDLSLALSSGSAPTPLMKPISFEVFDCSAQTSCGSCLAYDSCSWCAESLDTLSCVVTSSANCSSPLSDSSSCPTIASVSKNPLTMNSNTTVTLTLATDLASGSENSLSCGVSLTSLEHGGPLFQTSSFTFGSDLKTIRCNQLILSGAPGDATIGIYNTAISRYYVDPFDIPIVACPFFTDCTSCLTNGCHWCASGCAASCPVTGPSSSLDSGPNCPQISSVSPNTADSQARVRIRISGSNFMQPYTNPDLEDESTTGAPSPTSTSRQYELLADGMVDWSQDSEWLRREVMQSAGTFNDYYYRCRWGNIVTPAFWASSSLIMCDTPVIESFAQGQSYPVALMIGSSNYISAPSSVNMDFFQCPQIDSDSCTSECIAAAPCGWCVSQSSCTSYEACFAINATDSGTAGSFDDIEPIWQSRCVSANLDSRTSLVGGGTVLNMTFSPAMPASLALLELRCRFGTSQSDVIGVLREDDTQDIIGASCQVPPSPTGTTWSGLFDVTYKERRMTSSQRFVYVDCGRHKSCGSCQGEELCGWCRRSGGDRCTVASECPSTANWSRTTCPINVAAVVLGTLLGLLLVGCLAALIIYLSVRAYKRRKKGLVIKLQEPNYDVIAWGRDSVLQYKISPSKWSVLHAALCREDFLLQLAMSLNCPATEQESLSKGLVFVACAHDTASAMIRTLIRAEVEQCSAENQLFRSNSVASKMYKFFSRIVGIKYLFHCLARVIRELEVLGKKAVANSSQTGTEVSILNVTMELDMEKYDGSVSSSIGDIVETVDADTNLLQLQLICQKILNVLIKRSTHNIPRPLREIFVEIDASVSRKYPGSTEAIYKGLGGLFFLRFVCPAITAPHVYGLLESPPIEITQRQLVLIGKVIQSIANMSPPTLNKEGYMEPMANFIRSSIPRIREFYDNLRRSANISNHSTIYEREIVVPEEVLLNGLAATQAVLVSEAPKLRDWSQLPSEQSGISLTQAAELNQIIDACLEEESTSPKNQRASTGPSSKRLKTSRTSNSNRKKSQ